MRGGLLGIPGHGGREDGHGPAFLVWSSSQSPGMVLQGLLVGEIGGAIVVREVPVNVDIFKHCLFTSQSVQQLELESSAVSCLV